MLPAQGRILSALGSDPPGPGPDPAWRRLTVRLSAASGSFALLWAVVVAPMVVRPGSTTSV